MFCILLANLRKRVKIPYNLLCVNEDLEGEHNVAFKRGQRVLAHFAERSNEKKLNVEITLLDGFFYSTRTTASHNSAAEG